MKLFCFAVYVVFALIWIILLLVGGSRYGRYVKPLSKKEYPLKGLYPVGFQFFDWIHFSVDSPRNRKRIGEAKIIWGEKYGEYYYRVNLAEKYTFVVTFVMLTPLLGVIGSPALMLVGVAAAVVGYLYSDRKISQTIAAREDEITRDFADMVSKMALLINAGMITREAWEEISETGSGTLYDEMRRAVVDMRNGESEIDAYIAFGTRCGLQTVKKFTSMLVQNISKGNRELVEFLRAEAAVFWEEKKHYVRRQGEKATSKLLIPLMMIMAGIFIMILIPMVTKMGA